MLCLLSCSRVLCIISQWVEWDLGILRTCFVTRPRCWALCTAASAVERQALDSACWAWVASRWEACLSCVVVEAVFSLSVALCLCLFLELMRRCHIVE